MKWEIRWVVIDHLAQQREISKSRSFNGKPLEKNMVLRELKEQVGDWGDSKSLEDM